MKIEDIHTATPEEIKALQNKSFEILCYFKDFCQKHGLRFFLAGGTLIGAVRHQGFIPWDDDVDVFMLRKDYELLPELWNKFADTSKYAYCRTNLKENYHNTGASIRDNNTTFINKHSVNDDINHGLQIDILPIDVKPNGKLDRVNQIFWAMLYSLFNAQRLPDRQGGIIRGLSWILLNAVRPKKVRYIIWKYAQHKMVSYDEEDSNNYVELTSGIKSMFRPLSKSWFKEVDWKSFNGEEMPLMQGFDEYLTVVWGNYMELPPIEKRVAKHNTVCIDLDNGYKNYKGKLYLTN